MLARSLCHACHVFFIMWISESMRAAVIDVIITFQIVHIVHIVGPFYHGALPYSLCPVGCARFDAIKDMSRRGRSGPNR